MTAPANSIGKKRKRKCSPSAINMPSKKLKLDNVNENDSDLEYLKDKMEELEYEKQLENRKKRPKKTTDNETKKTTKEIFESDEYDPKIFFENESNFLKDASNIGKTTQMLTKVLPNRRVKRVIKLDPSVQRVSQEAILLMKYGVKLFIQDLTKRSYKFTKKDKRKSLQLIDLCRSVQSDKMYDFLIDVIPRVDMNNGNKDRLVLTYKNANIASIGNQNDDKKEIE